MSEQGHIDQVDADVMSDMRDYVGAMGDGPHAMTDEEVLDYVDRNYPGGAAQMNREQTSTRYEHPDMGGVTAAEWARADWSGR